MVNIYAPQGVQPKKDLWLFLRGFMIRNPGNYLFFGDFNAVRNSDERRGSSFCQLTTDHFNEFIDDSELVDIPMGGFKFTRSTRSGVKLSKLDRFLVGEQIMEKFPDLSVLALDRSISDHRPILLKSESFDYGPSTFKIFDSWFVMDVRKSWAEFSGAGITNLIYPF